MDVNDLFIFRRWAPCQSAVFGVCFTSSSVTICSQCCTSLTISVSAWTCQSTQRTCSCDVNTRDLFPRLHPHFSVKFSCPKWMYFTCFPKNTVTSKNKVYGGESSTCVQKHDEMKCPKLNLMISSHFIEAFVEVVYDHCQCCVPKTHLFIPLIIALYRLQAEKFQKGRWISCLFLLFQAHCFVKAENYIINFVSIRRLFPSGRFRLRPDQVDLKVR